jgi:hypothetical protein
MLAPLRIRRLNIPAIGGGQPDPLKDYTDRLIKLVPAEIVGLYMAGKVAINDRYPIGGPKPAGALLSESAAWIGWTLFCLIALVLIRRWATSDKQANIPPEWEAIGLVVISYFIWLYSLGDVFARVFLIWDPLIASLLVLGWTFLVPLLYM